MMKTEEVRRIAQDALDALAASLEQGDSESLRSYLAAMGRFHNYSVINTLLILTQRHSATRVAGFHAWKKLGRFVKKDERGIAIIAPMRLRDDDNDADDEEKRESLLRFKAAHVFDVAQTEGKALPELAEVRGDPADYLGRLWSLTESRGIRVQRSDDLGGADGASEGGTILLRSDMQPAQEFSVLAHELAHEMLHYEKSEDRPPKVARETEAEAVAFVVTTAIGLETSTAAADYIRLYRGDADTLAASLHRIQGAAATILQGLNGYDTSMPAKLPMVTSTRRDRPQSLAA